MNNSLGLASTLNDAAKKIETQSDKAQMVVNGWRTCAPLIEAAIKLDVDDVGKALGELIELTKTLSEDVFEQLASKSGTEQESVRAVVLELIKQAYGNDYREILKPEMFTDLVVKILLDTSITAEVGIEYNAPLLLAQAKLSMKLAAAFAKDTPEAVLTSRIRQHTSQILRAIKKNSQKLTQLHIDPDSIDLLHYVLIEDSGDIYQSIYKAEMKYCETASRGGMVIDNYDMDDIVIRKFKSILSTVIDALLVGGEIK